MRSLLERALTLTRMNSRAPVGVRFVCCSDGAKERLLNERLHRERAANIVYGFMLRCMQGVQAFYL